MNMENRLFLSFFFSTQLFQNVLIMKLTAFNLIIFSTSLALLITFIYLILTSSLLVLNSFHLFKWSWPIALCNFAYFWLKFFIWDLFESEMKPRHMYWISFICPSFDGILVFLDIWSIYPFGPVIDFLYFNF